MDKENIDPDSSSTEHLSPCGPSEASSTPRSDHRETTEEELRSVLTQEKDVRARRSTEDVRDMAKAGFTCCANQKCVEKFMSGEADLRRLEAEQADFRKQSSCRARLAWVRQTVPVVKLSKNNGSMELGGVYVCNNFYSRAMGVSRNLIENAKRNEGSPSGQRKRKRECNMAIKEENIVAFLDTYAERRGQFMPHKDATFLYLNSKKELHDHYLEDTTRIYGDAEVSVQHFCRVWKKHRPNLKPKTGGDFMKCHLCTLFSDTLHGSPGIKCTVDPTVEARTRREQTLHLEKVNADRRVIASISRRAHEARADLKPLRHVSMQADAANQTAFALPMQSSVTHGTDKGFTERQKIMAILIEGQFLEVFLTPQTVGGGSNLICTCIHRALTRLFERHVTRDTPAYIEELTLQVDNCIGENKNHILLGYLASLVGRGIIGKVTVNFMMVGHTHILLDQIFSRLAVGCKRSNLFTRRQQAEKFSESYKELPVHTTTLRSLAQFKGYLQEEGRIAKIKNITRPHSFQLLKHGPHQVTVGMKEYMHSSHFTGMTAAGEFTGAPIPIFTSGVPEVEKADPWEIKRVEPAVIAKIRQRYESVHCRVDCLFPGDVEQQKAIKDEMNESLRLLGASGSVPFHLDTWWLTRGTSSSDASDLSLETPEEVHGTQEEEGDEEVGSKDDAPAGEDSAAAEQGLEDGMEQPVENGNPPEEECGSGLGIASSQGGGGTHFKKGQFVFFLADRAPFLAGKVLSVRTSTDDGKEEIEVHWITPTNPEKRNNAANYSISVYGKAAFALDFLQDPHSKRYRPDKDWEKSDRVVASCDRMNRAKYIPAVILKTILAADQAKRCVGGAAESD